MSPDTQVVAANELDFDKRRQHQVDKCIENWKGEHFADQLLSDQKMLADFNRTLYFAFWIINLSIQIPFGHGFVSQKSCGF